MLIVAQFNVDIMDRISNTMMFTTKTDSLANSTGSDDRARKHSSVHIIYQQLRDKLTWGLGKPNLSNLYSPFRELQWGWGCLGAQNDSVLSSVQLFSLALSIK